MINLKFGEWRGFVDKSSREMWEKKCIRSKTYQEAYWILQEKGICSIRKTFIWMAKLWCEGIVRIVRRKHNDRGFLARRLAVVPAGMSNRLASTKIWDETTFLFECELWILLSFWSVIFMWSLSSCLKIITYLISTGFLQVLDNGHQFTKQNERYHPDCKKETVKFPTKGTVLFIIPSKVTWRSYLVKRVMKCSTNTI